MLSDKIEPVKTYPYQIHNDKRNNGMWVVHVETGQYRAWKYWLQTEIGRKFFPEPTMQVWFEWPPDNQAFADRVAQAISDIRDGFYTPPNGKTESRQIGGNSVPRNPRPWNGFIPAKPVEPPCISADAMREIRLRLCKNWVAGTKRSEEESRKPADQGPISEALRNRLGLNAPEPPHG